MDLEPVGLFYLIFFSFVLQTLPHQPSLPPNLARSYATPQMCLYSPTRRFTNVTNRQPHFSSRADYTAKNSRPSPALARNAR